MNSFLLLETFLLKFADIDLEPCSNMFTGTWWMHINGWVFITWLSWVGQN